jgi:2-polyprenyl-3-methyl-5-hydroxy-6-metoxy-1,4-benzoquinol methylase
VPESDVAIRASKLKFMIFRSRDMLRWQRGCSAVNSSFYDELAENYHLIFDDWEASIRRQRDVLARLLPAPAVGKRILDCSCGIGTQAIGLAMLGFGVEGSDPSGASINRARREAIARGLKVEFRVDDMRTLSTAPIDSYDVVIAMDNAVPHLQSDDDIKRALRAIRARLRSGGIVLISLRDYAPLVAERIHPRLPPCISMANFAGSCIRFGIGRMTVVMSSICS